MNKYTVYCHTNKTDGKKYIGITRRDPEKRWSGGKGYGNNRYFSRAIKKYGWNNFTHEILYTDLSKEEAEKTEVRLISKYQTTDHNKGYNIEHGGNATGKISDETKELIRQKMIGRVISEEAKLKNSIAHKGKPSNRKGCKMTPEQIEVNRVSHLGITPWNKGKRWSKEERAKFGGKRVLCVETGKTYRTAHEAGEELGLDFSSICACCRGKSKRCGGFHWKYAEEWELTDE